MNGMSDGHWKLRRESMFHSIIEEQCRTATFSIFHCASLFLRILSEWNTFPHFAQYETANPT